MAKNMDQKRASFALEALKIVNDPKQADELKTHSAKFIAQILTSGFLQAMDFAEIKFKSTYRSLQEWFSKSYENGGPGLSEDMREAAEAGKLNETLAKLEDKNEYRRAMQEAVVYLGWLKSKAEGRKAQLEQHPQ